MNFKTTIVVLCSVFSVLINPTWANPPLTLDDAIEIGLKNNYNIKIARNNAKIADNNKGYGKLGFLRSANLNLNHQLVDSDENSNSATSLGDNKTNGWGASLSIERTLFDGFKMFIEKKKYKELALLGNCESKHQIENSVISISNAFFNLVQQQQLLEATEEIKNISEMRLEQEAYGKEYGGSSSSDYLNALVAFNRDKSMLLGQEISYETAQKELNLLLGTPPETDIMAESTIPIIPMEFNLEEITDLTFKNSKEIKIAELNRQIAHRDVGISRSKFMPMLTMNAKYGYSDRTIASGIPDINTEKYDTEVNFVFSFNLFNSGHDKIALKNAKLQLRNMSYEVEDTRNQIKGLTTETYDKFQSQLQLIELEKQNLKAARQNLELTGERYKLGSTGSLEFRDAQVSLLDAQMALIGAEFEARLIRLQIEKLIGEINVD